MNKRGQFYLIAALVIIGIVAGLATVYTSVAESKEETVIYDLSKEINFEASQVIDNGVFEVTSQATINQNIENLTDFYSTTNPTSELLFVFGDQNTVQVIHYKNDVPGNLGISVGGSTAQFIIQETRKETQSISPVQNPVEIHLTPEIQYSFDLKAGKVFFIVLRKETGGESFVSLPNS